MSDRNTTKASGSDVWALAQALSQSTEILAEIAAGQTHPVMAAFGLWQYEEDLAELATEIERNRQNLRPRSTLTP
jgi:hypothetical protein